MATWTQLKILIGLLLAGSLFGFLVLEFFVVQYQATIALPIQGQIQIYRRAELAFRSATWFSRFAVNRGKSDDVDYRQVLFQLERGDNKPLTIEHTFGLSRADFRELPDGVAKELVDQLLRKDPFAPEQANKHIDSVIQVFARTRDPVASSRLAIIGIDFVQDVLLRIGLSDALLAWTAEAPLELARIANNITDHRLKIESISYRIKEMERVRDSYKELDQSGAGTAGVQVQIADARFLSPIQQILGAEAERVEATETLRLAEQARSRLETIARIGAELKTLLGEKTSSSDALRQMLARIRSLRTSAFKDASLPTEAAVGEIENRLLTMQLRYVDVLVQPLEPFLSRQGPGRAAAIILGLLAGLAAWLLLWRAKLI